MKPQDIYREMLDNLYEGVYFVDTQRRISFWNRGAERITGFSAPEVIGKYCYDNILNHVDSSGHQLCMNGCPLHKTLDDAQVRETGVFLHHKSGHRVPVFVRTFPIQDAGKVIGAVEFFVDDQERFEITKNLEELKVLAMRDDLTGLPNRRYLEAFMTSKFNEMQQLGIAFAVVFFDIDHFKQVNDTYGHDVGDRVLQMVARSAGTGVRSADMVGRWGGEEFLVILTGVTGETLPGTCEKIRMILERSGLREQDQEIRVTASLGATMARGEDTLEGIVQRADTLMYRSKEGGRNRVTIG